MLSFLIIPAYLLGFQFLGFYFQWSFGTQYWKMDQVIFVDGSL